VIDSKIQCTGQGKFRIKVHKGFFLGQFDRKIYKKWREVFTKDRLQKAN
jgi:hypothetical protein